MSVSYCAHSDHKYGYGYPVSSTYFDKWKDYLNLIHYSYDTEAFSYIRYFRYQVDVKNRKTKVLRMWQKLPYGEYIL